MHDELLRRIEDLAEALTDERAQREELEQRFDNLSQDLDELQAMVEQLATNIND
jgi:uncharacterized coiled-coil DUF342 family protein